MENNMENTVMAVIYDGNYVTRILNGARQLLAQNEQGVNYWTTITEEQILQYGEEVANDESGGSVAVIGTEEELGAERVCGAAEDHGEARNNATANTYGCDEDVLPSFSGSLPQQILDDVDDMAERAIEMPLSSNIGKKRKRDAKEPQTKWNHSNVLALIQMYKENLPLFHNQSVRNEIVWEKIRVKLTQSEIIFLRQQIINKFKYLKKLYIEKKDNMGPRATGQSPVAEFEFYEEFDEIFSKKPNVVPNVVVSSEKLNATKNAPPIENEVEAGPEEEPLSAAGESESSKPPPKPKNKVVALLQEMQKEKKERHEDMMARMEAMNERSCKVFEDVMQKLIDKM